MSEKPHILPEFVRYHPDGADTIHAGVERACARFHAALEKSLAIQGYTLESFAARYGISVSLLVSKLACVGDLGLDNMVATAAVIDCELDIQLKPKTLALELRPMVSIVSAVIFNGRELLTAKRASTKKLGGLWEFPGGKIEPGETPEQALRRELQEELGVEVMAGSGWEPFICESPLFPGGACKVHPFICYLINRDRIRLTDAHDEHAWITLPDLASLEELILTPVTQQMRQDPQLVAGGVRVLT